MSATPDYIIVSSKEQQKRLNACHKFISKICDTVIRPSRTDNNIRKWMTIFCNLVTDAAILLEDDMVLQVMNKQKLKGGSTEPIAVIEVLIWALKQLNSEHRLALREMERCLHHSAHVTGQPKGELKVTRHGITPKCLKT